jgi:CRISPR-associated protein Cst2
VTTIQSVSIACRVVMDLHALNNEGSESNRLMTRQVGIVTSATDENNEPGYRRDVVNAISGDMSKHIFADHFRNIASDMNLPLNPASQGLDPARIMGDPRFSDWVKGEGEGQTGKPDVHQVIDALLTCSLTDVCGILITAGGQSIKRKSAVEFGWTVGLPEITQVEEFIHARHAVTRLTRTKAGRGASDEEKDAAADEKSSNIGQMIFNRPANSGVYAFVAHLDVGAIGFNDATQRYPDEVEGYIVDRALRMRAALLALVQTVIHPKGALTSTQLPHVVDMDGFIGVSGSAVAAPLISPLKDDYIQRAEKVAGALNSMYPNANVSVRRFNGPDGLLEQTSNILDGAEPGAYVRYGA